MSTALKRRNTPRRGVTLVEMLVVVALVVLMMVILVQIFQSALGAMSVSRTTQELDVVLRSLDSMIRADLNGVTAKLTPPNDPNLKQGYFEYGENSPADLQGEDTDDFLAFTTKAPEGQVFSGRQYLSGNLGTSTTTFVNNGIQPITITSQVAEVIYFLRNGNLYRRVFLVAPDRAKSISTTFAQKANTAILNVPTPNLNCNFNTPVFGNSFSTNFYVSWLGMNDISCRPGGYNTAGVVQAPIPNDLGDLTNRENRAFRPRFINDFPGTNTPPDGIPDDNNGDGLNDYYPTLYYNGLGNTQNGIGWAPNLLVNESVAYSTPSTASNSRSTTNPYDVYAFPFIYPGMYSVPDDSMPVQRVTNGLGWVHYQPVNNHAPLDLGDNLPVPAANQYQTWWGFPTWRETMSGQNSGGGVGWADPVNFLTALTASNSYNATQPLGMRPTPPNMAPTSYLNGINLLPRVYQPNSYVLPPFSDQAGSSSFVSAPNPNDSTKTQSLNPNPIWEEDLILTNVRSFDVKAYDPDAPLYNNLAAQNVSLTNQAFSVGYQDLGYAGVVNGLVSNNNNLQIPVLFQTTDASGVSFPPVGFGHEGRMPPLFTDFRNNPKHYNVNLGETNGNGQNNANTKATIIRLTHTFDTWSTAYTDTPDSDIFLHGPSSGSLPVYPSFPAPYPSPLRGIQIQIRVTDPRNERTKVLTIRQDFTDKL